MSEIIEVSGGARLSGSVKVGGAKNAVLPLMIASLLTGEECRFKNVPGLSDVTVLFHLLRQFGTEIHYGTDSISLKTERLVATEASYSLVKALRASFWILAPLLARGGAARVALPGGDIIGARPVDIHLEGLEKMGADITVRHGVVYAAAPKGLRPADITFRFPSVGATHQLLLAAALTPGTTVLRGVAQEPEVIALERMLTDMGAEIEGAGSDTITVTGKEELGGADVSVIGDRIEAATYLCAGVMTQGEVTVEGIDPSHLGALITALRDMGQDVEVGVNKISIDATAGRISPIDIETEPFPGFATDMQAPLMAVLTMADGESSIRENIFEGRFGHISELCRMGADIIVQDRTAIIKGVNSLSGAPVESNDIRSAAALLIAGLAAEGTTELIEPQHIRRGYERLEDKIRALGGVVRTKIEDPEDCLFTGC